MNNKKIYLASAQRAAAGPAMSPAGSLATTHPLFKGWNGQPYNSAQLNFFRGIILEKKKRAEGDIAIMRESIIPANDTFGDDRTLAVIQNDCITERIARITGFVADLDRALIRIDQRTYGRCRSCGTIIPPDRLAAVPHATLCMACKK